MEYRASEQEQEEAFQQRMVNFARLKAEQAKKQIGDEFEAKLKKYTDGHDTCVRSECPTYAELTTYIEELRSK